MEVIGEIRGCKLCAEGEKEGEKGEGREVSDEMGARSSMDARDAKLAMKGLYETRTYRFPQLNSSSTLFSDNWKERSVKMRWQWRRGGNREHQEARSAGEAQQEGRKLQ